MQGAVRREASGCMDIFLLCGDFGKDIELRLDAAECSGWIHDTSRGTVSFIYLNKHPILFYERLYEIAPTQGESSYNVVF